MKNTAIYIISDGYGGAESVVWKIVRYLGSDLKLFLIVNDEIVKYYNGILNEDRILNIGKIYPHLDRKNRYFRYMLHNRYFTLKNFLVALTKKKIIKFCRENNISVINAHMEFALYSGSRMKKEMKDLRLIYTAHSSFGFDSNYEFKPQIDIKKLDFKSVDVFVFISEFLAGIYHRNNIPVKREKLIYNGTEMIPENEKNKINAIDREFRILFVGGEKNVKGYDLLVDTISIIAEKNSGYLIKVTILGNVEEDTDFRKRVADKGLEKYFEFMGFVSPPYHLAFFRNSHLLIMPSKSDAMPLAAIEAVMVNLPVVATRVGGIPEIIRDGENGLLCDMNPVELAEKIDFLVLNYTVFRSRLDEFNKLHSPRFSLKSFTEAYSALYKNEDVQGTDNI